jgi:hypothetical protein
VKLALIVAALQLVNPDLSPSTTRAWATEVHRVARARNIHPHLMLAVIWNESRGIASARNGDCIGLGQVCSQDAERQAELLNPLMNIRAIGKHLADWRRFCMKKHGVRGRGEERWLQGYQGYGPSCGVGRTGKLKPLPWLTRRVLACKNLLQRGRSCSSLVPPRSRS